MGATGREVESKEEGEISFLFKGKRQSTHMAKFTSTTRKKKNISARTCLEYV